MLPMRVPTAVRNPRRNRAELVSSPVGSWQGFTPLSLGPAMWFDASDTATITSSAGLVSQWDDKSGNARHATQATSSLQPTTGSQTQNGLNVLSFTNHKLQVSYTLNFNTVTVCAVALKAAAGAGSQTYSRVVGAWNTGDNAVYTGEFNTTNGYLFIYYTSATYNGFNPAANSYRNGASVATHLYVYNTASISTLVMGGGSVRFRHNGKDALGTTSTTAMNANQFVIGNAPFIADGALNGWIAEVVVIPRTINSVEIGLLEDYLKAKWATV